MQIIFRDCLCGIDGYTVEGFDDDGQPCYTIIINARLSDDRQRAAYYHEMLHIERGDFERARKIGVNEVEKDV